MAFLDGAHRSPGTVVELKAERAIKGGKKYHPIVRFVRSDNGRKMTFKSKVGLWPSPFEVGDDVEVAFDPDNPTEAEINSFWTMWFLPALMFLFGVACAAAGWFTLAKHRKRAG